MKSIAVRLGSLSVDKNGKPTTKEGVVLGRKSSYYLTLALFSPGANKDKAIVTVKGINDISKAIDYYGLNEATKKKYTLEERSVFTGKIKDEAQLIATLHYAEYDSIIITALRDIFGELIGGLDIGGLLGALSMTGIINLIRGQLIDVGKTLPKILKGERDEHLYEIGYGTLDIIEGEEPSGEIRLDVVENIERDISYTTMEGIVRLEDVLVVPKGDNGNLKLDIKIT